MTSQLMIFARFHAKEGLQDEVRATIHEVLQPTRQEPGCLAIDAYIANQDSRLFYIHSGWKNEAAFNHHAQLAHTLRFVERVQALIDHPLDVVRTRRLTDPQT